MKLKKTALAALSVAALVSSSLAIGATAASGEPGANVTICHRTNSDTNPYVQITVDTAAVDGVGGGNDHLGAHNEPRVWEPGLKAQHLKWGDIIPPFNVDGDPRPEELTLNWEAGQAIFENGCNPVEPPPEPELVALSIQKVVVGTAPGGATFTAQVTCDDGTDVAVTLPVAGGLGTPSPIEVELGSQCVVVETATGGATVGYSLAGVDVDPGVFIDTDTTVTITNTFDEPEIAPEVVTEAPVVAPAAVTATPRTTG